MFGEALLCRRRCCASALSGKAAACPARHGVTDLLISIDISGLHLNIRCPNCYGSFATMSHREFQVWSSHNSPVFLKDPFDEILNLDPAGFQTCRLWNTSGQSYKIEWPVWQSIWLRLLLDCYLTYRIHPNIQIMHNIDLGSRSIRHTRTHAWYMHVYIYICIYIERDIDIPLREKHLCPPVDRPVGAGVVRRHHHLDGADDHHARHLTGKKMVDLHRGFLPSRKLA